MGEKAGHHLKVTLKNAQFSGALWTTAATSIFFHPTSVFLTLRRMELI